MLFVALIITPFLLVPILDVVNRSVQITEIAIHKTNVFVMQNILEVIVPNVLHVKVEVVD